MGDNMGDNILGLLPIAVKEYLTLHEIKRTKILVGFNGDRLQWCKLNFNDLTFTYNDIMYSFKEFIMY